MMCPGEPDVQRRGTQVAGINLSELDFWRRPLADRAAAFAALRAEPPRHFPEPEPPYPDMPAGAGYYALVRHADVAEASRQWEVFSSARTSATNIWNMPAPFVEYFGSMINMDDPRHSRLRRIVSRAFSPRMLHDLEAAIDRTAARIVDDVAGRGACDFAADVAARLPLEIICNMMGVPPERYRDVLDRSNIILGATDPEYVPEPGTEALAMMTAGQELQALVQELAEARQERPTGDLAAALVNANLDGERLTLQELGSFFILLVVAGNETTRNAISHGLDLFSRHPEQWERLRADPERHLAGAVEEVVRVASPVIWMRRTANRDCEINGQRYREGDKVVLYYWSANRDERVFDAPETFDITRTPNPHVAFGGPGNHFCLGAHLARREVAAMLRELARRLPDIHTTGEPDRLVSMFINGIKHLPCAYTPPR
jgi:cytochrome P450